MDIRIMELANRAVRAIESIAQSKSKEVAALEKRNQILESLVTIDRTSLLTSNHPEPTQDITTEAEPNAD
jgi:hypothetical protein